MNLYLVVSELLTEIEWEDRDCSAGHEESYCIAELVLADKRGQAIWTAWSTDKNTFNRHNPTEMPRFSCRIVGRFPEETQRRVVSRDPVFLPYWNIDLDAPAQV